MTPETQTEVTKRIGDLLLLAKPERRVGNLLAVFGLFPTDFKQPDGMLGSYDANGLLIEADDFSGICTCSQDPKSPKIHRIPNDSELHVSGCEAYKAYALATHPNLIDAEPFERAGAKRRVFSFFWPRTLEARNRIVLVARFGELQAEQLWKNFQKTWDGIMALLPEPPASYAERNAQPDQGEPEPTPQAEAPANENIDFGEMTLSFDDAPTTTPEAPAASESTPTTENQPSIEEAAKETARKRRNKAKTEDTPPVEAMPNTTTPETPATQVPAAEPKAKEEKPEKAKETKEKPKKRIPVLIKFNELLAEEMAGIKSSGDFIAESESFPIDAIKQLKHRIDRLALKAAHLAYRGGHEKDDPRAINPLIEITLANVTSLVNTAIRDLGLCPEKPQSWLDFKKELKEACDIAESLSDVMAQMGVSDAIQMPPKLKDADGKALVP